MKEFKRKERKRLRVILPCLVLLLSAGIFLPGIFLKSKGESYKNEVHAVPKKYLSSSAAMARSASLNLKCSERLELVAGKWESDLERAESYEMAQTDYEAVMLAKKGLKQLYSQKLYPLDLEGYGRWYSWEADCRKAVDTTFHMYTAYYWIIRFQKYDGTDMHEIWMLDDGTIFMAYAGNMDGFASTRLRMVSEVMEQDRNVTVEQTDGFVPVPYQDIKQDGLSLMSECAYTKEEDRFFIRQLVGTEEYLYLLYSGRVESQDIYRPL